MFDAMPTLAYTPFRDHAKRLQSETCTPKAALTYMFYFTGVKFVNEVIINLQHFHGFPSTKTPT